MVRSNRSSGWGPFLPSTFAAVPTPGGVDRAVHAAEGLAGEGERGLDVGLAGDVGPGEAGPGAQLGGEGVARTGVHVEDDDVRARRVERAHGGPAQARGATCNQERLGQEFSWPRSHHKGTPPRSQGNEGITSAAPRGPRSRCVPLW